MSVETAVEFIKKVAEDDGLKQQLADAMSGQEGEAVFNAISEVGADSGFSFAPEDIAIAGRQLGKFLGITEDGEMSDEEMEGVAGGINFGGLWNDVGKPTLLQAWNLFNKGLQDAKWIFTGQR